jgi:hypothetical protein
MFFYKKYGGFLTNFLLKYFLNHSGCIFGYRAMKKIRFIAH